jgi:hypothetical protein
VKLLPNTLLEKQPMSENSPLIPNNFQAAEQSLKVLYFGTLAGLSLKLFFFPKKRKKKVVIW